MQTVPFLYVSNVGIGLGRLMKRRDFITLAGGVAVWPLSARAQQPKVYRVGVLLGPAAESVASLFHALKEGLRERGFVEGAQPRLPAAVCGG
jgi:putative ABC transport system substrate-binding protein